MKRKGYKISRLIKTAAAVLAAGAAVYMAAPALSPLLMRAAAFSAALSMPEASVEGFLDRLKGERAAAPAEAPAEPPPGQESEPEAEAEQEPSAFAPVFWPPAEPKPEPPSTDAYEQPDPVIPEGYKGRVLAENMSDTGGRLALIMDGFRLRNDTALPAEEIISEAEQPFGIELEQTTEPQVLIYHTHATESYCPYDDGYYDTRYNWRSTDNNNNMVAVGAVMAQALKENGISVIQDTSQHDYPSYNGSYANSYRSVKDYLYHYPTIKVVLDIHRDAIEREPGLIIKPTIEHNGESYAQLMLVSNCDDGSGLLPNWRENLRFAAAFASELEEMVPEITRPVLFSYRKYNQQLSNGALLLEFGSHANTMEEAQRTARVAGEALAKLLNSTKQGS